MGYTKRMDSSDCEGGLLRYYLHRMNNTTRFRHNEGFKELEMGMLTFRAQVSISQHPNLTILPCQAE